MSTPSGIFREREEEEGDSLLVCLLPFNRNQRHRELPNSWANDATADQSEDRPFTSLSVIRTLGSSLPEMAPLTANVLPGQATFTRNSVNPKWLMIQRASYLVSDKASKRTLISLSSSLSYPCLPYSRQLKKNIYKTSRYVTAKIS